MKVKVGRGAAQGPGTTYPAPHILGLSKSSSTIAKVDSTSEGIDITAGLLAVLYLKESTY
jgi:hypothetical protein